MYSVHFIFLKLVVVMVVVVVVVMVVVVVVVMVVVVVVVMVVVVVIVMVVVNEWIHLCYSGHITCQMQHYPAHYFLSFTSCLNIRLTGI